MYNHAYFLYYFVSNIYDFLYVYSNFFKSPKKFQELYSCLYFLKSYVCMYILYVLCILGFSVVKSVELIRMRDTYKLLFYRGYSPSYSYILQTNLQCVATFKCQHLPGSLPFGTSTGCCSLSLFFVVGSGGNRA